MVVAIPAQVVLPDGLKSYYKEHLLPQLTSWESSAGTECGSQFNTEVDNPEPDDQDREEQQDSTAKDTDVLPDEQDELTSSNTHARDWDQDEDANASRDRGCNIQNGTCNRKKNTSTPTSSEEAGSARSQRRSGLRTKTAPPTRLMTLHMMLEDEPP